LGKDALLNNTIGNGNIALGEDALKYNDIGSGNTAIGNSALKYNSTGDGNNAFGAGSLPNNTFGDYNNAFGLALSANTTGSYNNGFGWRALNFSFSGWYNNAFGGNALYGNTTGNKNTGLGHYADVLASNLNFATALGAHAKVGCSNCLALGGDVDSTRTKVGINMATPTTDLHIKQQTDLTFPSSLANSRGIKLEHATTTNQWRTYVDNNYDYIFAYNNTIRGNIDNATGVYTPISDSTMKKNIAPMSSVLQKVSLLKPSTYQFKTQENTAPKSIGFISQEVQQIYPELVKEVEGKLLLNYDGFGVIAIKAIQEQQAVIQTQNEKIQALEKLIIEIQQKLK
jgi:hypothetical protein